METGAGVGKANTNGRRPAGTPTLEVIGISKDFGALRANDSVNFSVMPGEIHALLGENGAGKSTLVKIIYGALQPTEGAIRWKGKPVTISNPAAARQLGIGMVFQHFSLFEALTVTENIALALPKSMRRRLAETVAQVSADYGLPLRPHAIVADLSVGERQRIEIVRCLLQKPQLLIMDEPTSVLTPQEADHLFVTLQRLAGEGCAVLYISHRLEEVQRICHHATIMRRGRVVAETDPAQETAGTLARLMVGSELLEIARAVGEIGKVRLSVNALDLPTVDPFGVSLKDVSLEVRGGEVVAIAGIAGNGQSELFAALSGEVRLDRADAVAIDGKPCGLLGITGRRNLGAAFVPEERLGHSAVPGLKLTDNVILTRHRTGDELVVTGVVRPSKALKILELGDHRLRCAQGHDRPRGAIAVGRQPAEIRGRTGDRSPAGHAGGLTTHLGRRCRRRGPHPSGADRPGAGRLGGAGHQPGPRRDLRDRRPHRGDFTRPPVAGRACGHGDARVDRPAHGRHRRRQEGSGRRDGDHPCSLGSNGALSRAAR